MMLTRSVKRPVDTPVMKAMCVSCPFAENGCIEVRNAVQSRVLEHASQLCHHPRISGHKETHLCRGARDFQLTIYYRMGFIMAPTDDAWTAKCRELGIGGGEHD